MKKLLIGVVALPFLTGIAVAGQPTALSDKQMDRVTAGCVVGCVHGELENIAAQNTAAVAAASFSPSKSGIQRQ